MKNILILTLFVFITLSTFAQNGPRERIKAFKVAYITEKLDLKSKEAQQFWPVYNEFEEKIDKLKRQERKLIRGIKEMDTSTENLSETQAEDYINQYLEAEKQKSLARQQLIVDLKQILPSKKILKLIKAEGDFNRRMLDRIRERRKMK